MGLLCKYGELACMRVHVRNISFLYYYNAMALAMYNVMYYSELCPGDGDDIVYGCDGLFIIECALSSALPGC